MYQSANHPINVSAYFDDSQRYGNFSGEVSPWTNTHYAWCYRYAKDSATPPAVWIKGLVQSCQRAYEAKRSIHLDLNLQETNPFAKTPLEAVLKALTPFWDRVSCLELADEPRWTSFTAMPEVSELARKLSTAATVAKTKATVTKLGLSQRPCSVVYSTGQFPGAPVQSLDIVGIEAYCNLPGSTFSVDNVKWLTSYLSRAKAAVPTGKQIHIVPMSYSRNYAWLGIGDMSKGTAEYSNAINTLIDLQNVAYKAAATDKRVIGLNFFSWARASGSQEYPKLAKAVKDIGRAACKGK
jgi:hypothetical protein